MLSKPTISYIIGQVESIEKTDEGFTAQIKQALEMKKVHMPGDVVKLGQNINILQHDDIIDAIVEHPTNIFLYNRDTSKIGTAMDIIDILQWNDADKARIMYNLRHNNTWIQEIMKLYLTTPMVKYDIVKFPEKSEFFSLIDYMHNANDVVFYHYIFKAVQHYHRIGININEECYHAYRVHIEKIPLPYKSQQEFNDTIEQVFNTRTYIPKEDSNDED